MLCSLLGRITDVVKDSSVITVVDIDFDWITECMLSFASSLNKFSTVVVPLLTGFSLSKFSGVFNSNKITGSSSLICSVWIISFTEGIGVPAIKSSTSVGASISGLAGATTTATGFSSAFTGA